ncbi:hypothetical protein ACE02Y_14715 [Shewanella xiamenensis]|jgi:hypothetical protein|uniref:Uncharacterized protein n=1 Tax=Shewanella xiamenensis TaxID=332186 RepID=A0AAE4Q019_9GAMM|nr:MULTISPECIES: hypothetical protein [Shewanella]KEK27449.1 hypothetical protein SXM_2991 [Shewanella xiamenensis]MDH1627519.1 hypothetical protein [Shewanella xiamenensis]MDL3984289.1 hypothetical protein [Shewanella xiamenensis]MDV5391341.1 hypothetical protein [Shewanella xiamenensis]QQK58997.1 hypothetical protein FJD32_005350 [Shewanella sp. LC6]
MDSLTIFKSRLPFYCEQVIQELTYFKHFNCELEELSRTKSKELDSEISSKLSHSESKFHEDIIDFYQWDSTLVELFPSIHRESLLISIFNLLEHHLNVLCTKFGDVFAFSVKAADLKDRGITRSFSYLKKVVSLSFESIGKEKEFISNVNKLRNFIVHNGSIIDKSHAQNFVKNSKLLSLTSGNRLIIHDGFISDFIDVLSRFWDVLGKLVLEHCQLKLAIQTV